MIGWEWVGMGWLGLVGWVDGCLCFLGLGLRYDGMVGVDGRVFVGLRGGWWEGDGGIYKSLEWVGGSGGDEWWMYIFNASDVILSGIPAFLR